MTVCRRSLLSDWVLQRPCHRRGVLLAVAIAVSACSDPVPIASPEVVRPEVVQPSPNSWTIRGTVFAHSTSEMRPLGGVRLQVYRSTGLISDVVHAISSADGSYEAGQVDRVSSFVWVGVTPNSPYLNPCPPFTWTEQRLDVHVIATEIVSTTGIPMSFPTNPTGNWHAPISGRVFERTADGSRAIPGASVALDGYETRSNTSGHYLLCSVGNSEVAVTVTARKDGYAPGSVQGLPWFGWELDFELTRR